MSFDKGNPFALLAKERARKKRRNKLIVFCLMLFLIGITIGGFLFTPTKYRVDKMPKHGEFVIAYKWNSWYKAYVDENGEFRHAEDGNILGTVIYWSRP